MSTSPTEQVQITAEHVGRVWVDRYTTENVLTARGFQRTKPQEWIKRYVVVAVEPVDSAYIRDYPTAGPRVKVTLCSIRRDGTHNPKFHTTRWLPTTGNEKTVEIEVTS